jgi:hypothetical protein
MVRLVLLTLALAAAPLVGSSACGSSKPGENEAAAAADEEPVSEHGKKWGGWRWKGKRNDCFFLVDNACHDTFEGACKAAKCKESECLHDESAPAVVSCKK